MFNRSDALDSIIEEFALLWCDLDTGEILYATRPAERMFGYGMHGALVGKNVDDLVPDQLRDAHKVHRQNYAEHPGMVRPMGFGRAVQGKHFDGRTLPLYIGLGAEVLAGRRTAIAVILERVEAVPDVTSTANEMASKLERMAGQVREIGDKVPGVSTANPPPLSEPPRSEAKP